MKTHNLKTWPEYFSPLKEGIKTFEVRKNDRGFEVGDTLILEEWDPVTGQYTGRAMERVVSYCMVRIIDGVDSVVMGFKDPERDALRQIAALENELDADRSMDRLLSSATHCPVCGESIQPMRGGVPGGETLKDAAVLQSPCE